MVRQKLMICWLALLFIVLGGQVAQAQKMAVTIKDVKIGTVKTPDYKDSKEPNKNYWCRLLVNFNTSGAKWINELDVRWTVATFNADGKLVVMRETVTYEDIEDGRAHRACVYIKPSFPRKYQNRSQFDGNSMAVFVEILYGGKRLAVYEDKRSGKLPDKWYEKVQNGPTLKGQLLPKSKTPFAPMDYDFFEHEKIN